ncbi:MAG: YicC family protein [Bdellovibrionales bacterium]|nr:YicC family protein [Bdellovibrionales bacterium]
MNSMTGFGRAEAQIGSSQVTVEIKSVNHRFLDTRFRMPPFLSPYELRLTETLRSRFERGAFEISIRHKPIASGAGSVMSTRFVVDQEAAKSFKLALDWLQKEFKTEPPSLDLFANSHRIVVAVEETEDLEEAFVAVEKVFQQALDGVAEMRASEGKKLSEILLGGLRTLSGIISELEKVAPLQPKQIADKLTKRLERWQLNTQIDSSRLEQEIALYAEKSDFTEELDRLRTHEKAFGALIAEPGSLGRRLDFLTQEFHREFNTLSSKAAAVEITRLALTGKSEIEKLRQQVQNVE